ncbi:hypothetical protein ACFYZJ_37715 [Streptomyces sp. NPDC001848]|uniref:hypothetical protein n=1 Tax=Streptomyces sp. NPDC001848 TaxID=3364618 RepID=UPI0036B57C78
MSQQNPHQPGWATPQQPPRKHSAGKIVGFGCLGIVGLFFVLGAIGAALDNGHSKTSNASSTTSPGPAKASTTASKAPTTATSAKAAAPAKPGASSAPAQKLPPAEARKKAAAILRANDAYYQEEFNHGVTVTLNRGTDNSFPAFHAWQQKAATDVKPGMDAFTQADGYFTADDEPASISDWRDDNGTLSADIAQLANDGLDVGGPDDAAARQKVQADASKFPHDFQVAEADVDKVAAGK